MGFPRVAVVPGNGQIAMFLNEVPGFSALPSTFQGVVANFDKLPERYFGGWPTRPVQ